MCGIVGHTISVSGVAIVQDRRVAVWLLVILTVADARRRTGGVVHLALARLRVVRQKLWSIVKRLELHGRREGRDGRGGLVRGRRFEGT